MTDICCHFGIFTRRKTTFPMVSHPQEEIIAQGDYFKIPVSASSSPGSNQARCEEARKDLYYAFKDTAAKAVPFEFDVLFESDRNKVPNFEAFNTPIESKEEVKVNDELWGTIKYTRTTVYTVAAAFPERCEPKWCGVEGSIGERQDSDPVAHQRSITQRATAGYRYFSTIAEYIDDRHSFEGGYRYKSTKFSFPVTKVGAENQCSCKTLTTNYPPSHSPYMDAVLPWRDWIGPPSDRLRTDGKYSKDLCAAQ